MAELREDAVVWLQPQHPATRCWRRRLADHPPMDLPPLDVVRFHSLTGSRQYPRSRWRPGLRREDPEQLLHRHTTLIGDLHAESPGGYLVRPVWGSNDTGFREDQAWRSRGLGGEPWALVQRAGDDELDESTTIALTEPCAGKNWLDWWLIGTAEEQVYGAMLVAADASWVARPYPGGMDVAALNGDLLDDLADRYAGWLPPPLR